MEQQRIVYLLGQRAANRLSVAEQQEFEQLLENPAMEEAFVQAAASMEVPPEWVTAYDEPLERILEATLAYDRPPVRRMTPVFRKLAVAAAIALLVGAGLYMLQSPRQQPPLAYAHPAPIIPPGHTGAILTLDDGSQVVLDSLGNGWRTTQSGARLQITNGQLQYTSEGTGGKIAINTTGTPKGRQFALVLPDGTKVWLNSESSITYPTAFSGKERSVKLNGEAYFEVAADPHHPFIVQVTDQTSIEVLGTDFNIKAYSNDARMEATLVSGAVRVAHGQDKNLLKPGQQARMTSSGMTVLSDVDIENVIAWKNGLFNFEGIQLADAMHQIERWYNIKVQYENGIPDIRFGGKVNRNISLNELLRILARADLKFRLESDRLTILRR
ncbi:MAG: FecR domain-containing protein [Chitinophaga sp.]|uniref:FecR family protein n=1 Tax=Chitinophaga sp. TaxID=1869181 RepID=UPI0025BE094E|nr:FecR family protein [Chitinophaga sp.]MBV8252254.1 FecR domain-containing protein [Chitinophaga sp.]